MRRSALGILICGLLASQAMAAVDDKYHVTAAEKIACTRDAMRLCFGTYPDEDALLRCMKSNEPSLTPTCRTAFVAGMRRRGLQ